MVTKQFNANLNKASTLIKQSQYTTVFTGAGISVESGIPPFRGETGLWSKYNPIVLDINYFKSHPYESWKVIKEIFYDFFGKAEPNPGHIALAKMEKKGLINNIITQNIDNLHQKAGSNKVFEFHGNSHTLVCMHCGKHYSIDDVDFQKLPIRCIKCGHLVKPNFVFFGEGIPDDAYKASLQAAQKANLFIVVGTTGEIMPASQIPYLAKQNGAKIIEINPETSNYTNAIVDIYIKGKAGIVLPQLLKLLF